MSTISAYGRGDNWQPLRPVREAMPSRLVADEDYRSAQQLLDSANSSEDDTCNFDFSHFGKNTSVGSGEFNPSVEDEQRDLGYRLTMAGEDANPSPGLSSEAIVAFFDGATTAWVELEKRAIESSLAEFRDLSAEWPVAEFRKEVGDGH